MGRFNKTFSRRFKPRKGVFKVKARRVDLRPPCAARRAPDATSQKTVA